MPSQAEVLEAIKKLGWADYKRLKEYFGMDQYQGNSNLPQRIKALQKRGKIVVMRFGCRTIFMPAPDEITCTREEAEQILLEWGFKKRKRGMPKGKRIIREESAMKVLRLIREHKLISWTQLKRALNWRTDTLNKYLNYLTKNGFIFEKRVGKLRLYTTSLL